MAALPQIFASLGDILALSQALSSAYLRHISRPDQEQIGDGWLCGKEEGSRKRVCNVLA